MMLAASSRRGLSRSSSLSTSPLLLLRCSMATYRGGGSGSGSSGGRRRPNQRFNNNNKSNNSKKNALDSILGDGGDSSTQQQQQERRRPSSHISAAELSQRTKAYDAKQMAKMDEYMKSMESGQSMKMEDFEELQTKLVGDETEQTDFLDLMKKSEARFREQMAKESEDEEAVRQSTADLDATRDKYARLYGDKDRGVTRAGYLTDLQVAEYSERMRVESLELKAPFAPKPLRKLSPEELAFREEYTRLRRTIDRSRDQEADTRGRKQQDDDKNKDGDGGSPRIDIQALSEHYMRPRVDMDKSPESYYQSRTDDFFNMDGKNAPKDEDDDAFDFSTAKLTSEPPNIYNYQFPKAPDVHKQLLADDDGRPDGTLPYYVKVKLRLLHPEHRLLNKWAAKWREKLQTLVVVDQQGDSTPVFQVPGFVYLPTRTKKLTILSSPHVHKKSRTQLEINTHRRLVTAESTGSRNRIREAVSLVQRAVEDQSDFGHTQETDLDMYRSHIGYFRLKYKNK